jgi:hypothetical protein
MPTPDQWHQVYLRQSAALEKIALDVAKLSAGGGGAGGGGGDGTIPFLRYIGDEVVKLKTALVEQLKFATVDLGIDIDKVGSGVEIAGRHVGSALAGGQDIRDERLATRAESVAGAIDKVAAALAVPTAESENAQEVARLTRQILNLDLKPGSPSPAEHRARAEEHWRILSTGLAKLFGGQGEKGLLEGAINQLVQPIVSGAAGVASAAMAPLQVPFREILRAGITDLLASIKTSSADHPGDPVRVALDAVLSAQRLGHAAHGLAIAAEAHPLFHALGFSQLSAAVVDLAGFAPLSQAALRPYVEAAIARPMRYATNEQFQPYIPGDNALADHVRRRTLNLTDYDRWLAKLGYAEGHRDRMIETVWRDPSIRDLALMLEDVPVDEEWLKPRVRTMGYDDADADQITAGIVARTGKASRERLRAQAGGAYAEGTISVEEYEAVLADLRLSADAVRWERRAAELQRRRDAVKDALTTYRRQYVDGVLLRDDYLLALDILGVDPERVTAIVADADSLRFPRIQREEEAAVAATLTELRRELVPRYRQLYTLGLVGADEYQRMLEQAGITPTVAAQAVVLDTSRIRAAAAATGSAAVERQLAELLRERQALAIQQYRRDQLTDAQLAVALLAAGRPPDQVDVVVAQERLLRIPIPSRPPAIAAEAVDRLTPEFRRRAALEDYRAGRIGEQTLYDELLAVGRTPDQADAEVGYELARWRPPKS